ncbi:MAG: hypothetical protein IJC78_02860 [Clostridia bacterium]|nr:hypothetical protein [Clostridia bacterium]
MQLNGSWILKGTDEKGSPITLPVTVPGCVHTDLWEHGYIKDLYYRDNSKYYGWIEDRNFTYERTFLVEQAEKHAYLEFDGLDTYCDIFLNGVKVGEAENMFIPYAFPVDGVLKNGENTLRVEFRSPIAEVADRPPLPGVFTTERLHTRRMQCTYGWDWVDRFVTQGIFRDVRLTFRKPNEIDNVYVFTKRITPYAAQVKIEIAFRDVVKEQEAVSMEIFAPDGACVFSKTRMILKEDMDESVDVVNPQLWFPNGYGEQPLYKLVLKTKHSEKEVMFGIREITVLQIEDTPGSEEEMLCKTLREDPFFCGRDRNESGACFTVLVNGVKIMCKGGNWVPCEPFPSAETPEKIKTILSLAKNAGMNMIRIWGGGIFEQDALYELCDRFGILVTQDFLMACGQYPEKEEWFIKALNEEAKYAALRLRNHPCLAWWTGDNENGELGSENKTDFMGYLAATYGAEPVLKQYDRERYFFPSSPYGGDYYSSITRGTTHNTNFQSMVYDEAFDTDFKHYPEFFSKMFARFSVEQMCLGLPFVSSLLNFMTEEDIYGPDTTISEYHMRDGGGKRYTLFEAANQMAKQMFGDYTDGKDGVKKQQMLQTEWIRLTLETHRRHKWFSSGIVYWMVNDCWPAANGWSIIDYYAKPKPAYYAFQRGAKPLVSSLERKNEKLLLHISNDGLLAASGSATVFAYDVKRKTKTVEKEIAFSVDANETAAVAEFDFSEFDRENTVILCDMASNLGEDRTFYVKDGLRSLGITYEDAEIVAEDQESITVKAESFIPVVLLDVPEILEENCFPMLAGETKRIMKR